MSKTEPSENGMEVDEEDYEDFICEYCDKEFITTKECDRHEKSCKANIVEKSSMKQKSTKKEVTCTVCGTVGHHLSNCHLKRYIDHP